jgi:hypothetical protein
MNTAILLMDVRRHFVAAEHARRTGGTYEAGEGSSAANAIGAAMRNMLAAGLTHAQALGALRDLAGDVVRSVRNEMED